MMIFKHLLTAWFLVFTLLSGVAWAHADHGDENLVNPALDAPIEHDHPLPWQNDDCSDHCCHAAAHVVALIGRACECMANVPLSLGPALSDTHPDSLPLAPPYHPPIV